MLSKKMAYTLRGFGFNTSQAQTFRDGRTVRALQSRGLIKNVRQEVEWQFKLTAKGIKLVRQLHFIDNRYFKELFS